MQSLHYNPKFFRREEMWYEYSFSIKYLTIIYQGQRTALVVLDMEYTPLSLLQVSLVDNGGLAIIVQ